MKIDFEIDKENRECLAILHNSGTIILKTSDGCIAFDNMSLKFPPKTELSFWDEHAKQKFYSGDKIVVPWV